MKKNILSLTIILALFICMVTPEIEVKASASEQVIIDNSILLNDVEESIGEMIIKTRGQYLQTGSSSIGKIGTGKIKVSATTIAQKVVSTIKVGVRVEQLVNGSWLSYTSWQSTKNNTYTITSAKELTVPRGYYYRVWSTHIAGSDLGNSNTNALYVN